MRVLGLDLTGTAGSIAIVEDGQTVIEEAVVSTDGFAHVLFDRLKELLGRAGWTLAHMDCCAAAAGPGSFTGVRAGLAAAKGLAEGAGIPAIGISNLRALASLGKTALRLPILDARRGAVYAGLFRADLTEVRPESVGPLLELVEMPDWESMRGDLSIITPDPRLVSGMGDVRVVRSPSALASAVARCALLDLKNGAEGDPALPDANYVRRSDAEMFWSDR